MTVTTDQTNQHCANLLPINKKAVPKRHRLKLGEKQTTKTRTMATDYAERISKLMPPCDNILDALGIELTYDCECR
jgi:hypothetical protein